MKAIEASLVLHNGKIHTLDTQSRVVDAIAFGSDGRIMALGGPSELRSLVGSTTRLHDLQGQFAMPGLIDFHMHALPGMVVRLHSTALEPTGDFAAVLDKVGSAAHKPADREWIIGSAFGAAALIDMERLGPEAKRKLDAVSNGRPVVLEHVSGHGVFANSVAMARAGITSTTPNPADGEIVRIGGEATGLLRETAAWLVQQAVPPLDRQQMVDVARQAVHMFNSVGITGFCDASTTADMLDVFRVLDDEGDLTCWAGFTLALSPTCPGYDRAQTERLIAQRREMCGTHMIAEAAKIFLDGVPSLRTAAMLDPYPSNDQEAIHHYGGDMSLTVEELASEIASFDRQGLSVKVHAIGDRAVRTVLEAVEHVRGVNGADGPQHHIAHGQFIRHEDIPRLRQLNILADLNPPLWFPSSASVAHQNIVGEARYATTWPIRSLLEAGTDVAVGSDWLTVFAELNPWQALSGLLTRTDPAGKFPGVHAAEQAISLAAALPLFTSAPARAMRLGSRTGSLTVGRSGDVIVLDRDLFAVAADEIAATEVVSTYFEGRLVHNATEI